MSDEKNSTTATRLISHAMTPAAGHYMAGGTAMSALRLLARKYGEPCEGGSLVPQCWEWDMAVAALDQWEALERESED